MLIGFRRQTAYSHNKSTGRFRVYRAYNRRQKTSPRDLGWQQPLVHLNHSLRILDY